MYRRVFVQDSDSSSARVSLLLLLLEEEVGEWMLLQCRAGLPLQRMASPFFPSFFSPRLVRRYVYLLTWYVGTPAQDKLAVAGK